MTINQLRTIAETYRDGKPDYKSPAYVHWLQAVGAFLRFAEESNDAVDIDKLEALLH